mmetsp:Transcript_51805/g.125045  ORF Transcript_51805/g.125045 Transcript_51805/m.125045 type:complete len:84 (+) Transcript_51805:140-391(+)
MNSNQATTVLCRFSYFILFHSLFLDLLRVSFVGTHQYIALFIFLLLSRCRSNSSSLWDVVKTPSPVESPWEASPSWFRRSSFI